MKPARTEQRGLSVDLFERSSRVLHALRKLDLGNSLESFFRLVSQMTDARLWRIREKGKYARWFRTTKNRDVSTGSLARPFARSLVHSLCSLIRWLRTARFVRGLRSAHMFAPSLTHSRACGENKRVNDPASGCSDP